METDPRRFIAVEGELGGFEIEGEATRAADDDDHYYGAWVGGKKSEGGHPAGGKGEGEAEPESMTFEEANKRLLAAGYTAVDMAGITKTALPEMTAALEQLAKRYPEVMRDNYIGIRVDDMPTAYARCKGMLSQHEITFSLDYFATAEGVARLESELERDFKSGWSSTKGLGSVADHEFGHIVDRHLHAGLTSGEIDHTDDRMPFITPGENRVSRYAHVNSSERFAETFAAIESGRVYAGSTDWAWESELDLELKALRQEGKS